MAASDYVPIFFKYRLHLAGRPQMSTPNSPAVFMISIQIISFVDPPTVVHTPQDDAPNKLTRNRSPWYDDPPQVP